MWGQFGEVRACAFWNVASCDMLGVVLFWDDINDHSKYWIRKICDSNNILRHFTIYSWDLPLVVLDCDELPARVEVAWTFGLNVTHNMTDGWGGLRARIPRLQIKPYIIQRQPLLPWESRFCLHWPYDGYYRPLKNIFHFVPLTQCYGNSWQYQNSCSTSLVE